MPQPNENGHTIWYENEEDKQMVMNFLNHIKLKTGENNGRIILKALQLYNMELE